MLSNQAIDLTRYQILEKIGHGNFGHVFRVKDIILNKVYAAKISKDEITQNDSNSQKLLFLFRETNIMSVLNHPTIIQFIGFSPIDFKGTSHPTIITEYAANGTLKDIINSENEGLSQPNWNDTQKLISIYGIASGMAYLHHNKIVHRDLKPENILMSDLFFPKISDFGLSKIYEYISESMNEQSQSGIKGTPLYMSPEIFSDNRYSEASDVYAFSLIVYQIMTKITPFKDANFFSLMKKVCQGERPEFPENIQKPYRDLIEKCWSQDPEKRPSFDEILDILSTNHDFITESINADSFYQYIDYLKQFEKDTPNIQKKLIKSKDFLTPIKPTENDKNEEPTENDKNEEPTENDKNEEPTENDKNGEPTENDKNEEPTENDKNEEPTENDKNEEPTEININEESNGIYLNEESKEASSAKSKINKVTIYPFLEFYKLKPSCQSLVREAENSPVNQFFVGKSLIEGNEKFPQNIQLGLKYLELAKTKKVKNALIYLSHIYTTGEIIPEDLEKARLILDEFEDKSDASYLYSLGMIERKEKNYQKAFELFQQSSRLGQVEATFYCGEMLMNGEGVAKDKNQGKHYLNIAKKNGFNLKSSSKKKKVKGDKERENLNITQNKLKFKVVVIGRCSGKSYTLHNLLNLPPPELVPTVFDSYDHTCNFNGIDITINFWDTAGALDLENIRVLSYPHTDLFVLFFTLNDFSTLEELPIFLDEVRTYLKYNNPYILVGSHLDKWCKEDLYGTNVTEEQILQFTQKYKINKVFLVSNTTKQNIPELYQEILNTCIEITTSCSNEK